ncbi:MAG TPA: AAA family ATPase [Caldimonas sp.]
MRAASRGFTFEPARELRLPGKTLQVNGYVLRSRAAVEAAPTLPMVGRDADLEHLQFAARRSFGEGRPQLVSIIAPAGAGKSRLVEEFLAHLPATEHPPLVAVAQCLPYGQRLTFWPLCAVLHRFVGLTGEAPVEDLQPRVAAWLRSRGVPEPEWAAGLLASTVGAAETAQPDRVAMFNAWRRAVQAAGSAGPVVIVFEDLHWSSDTLLDLVEHVMQPWAELPILMIALTRPELLDRRPAWGGGKRNYISIALEPLGDKATSQLVRQLLETASDEVVRRVVARAEGNPFYAGELVRAVMEQTVDRADQVAIEHALAHLPDTVHAAVLARLDLLPAAERWALQLGAAMGRSFAAEAIAALGKMPVATVSATCHLLVDRDLLRPSGDSYAFRHILIREVAYQTLPRAERARLHAAAAAWLEERAAGREEALAELVAFHYREAVALAGAGASAQTRRRTVDWLSRAAEAAYSGAATVEAHGHLRAAIELAEPSRLPDLHERLGASMQSGSAADAPLRTALKLSEEQGRPAEDQLRILARLLMFAMRSQGSVAARMGDAEMSALRARGRELLAQVDPEGPAAARFLAADSFYPFWMTGRATDVEYAAAQRDAKRAAEIAERLGDDDLLSAALDAMIGTTNTQGSFREGLEISKRRVALGRRVSAFERLDAYSMVTWGCSALGDLAGADAASAEGLAQVQPGQEPAWNLHLLAWRIYTLTLMGRWEAVAPLGQRARQLWEEIERETAGYALRGFVAAVHVAQSRGESALAASLVDVVESILREFGDDRRVRGGVRSRWIHLLHFDRAGLEEVTASWALFKGIPDSPERLTSAMSDRLWTLPASITAPQLDWAVKEGLRPLEIQVRRAIGLRDENQIELARAAEIAATIGAGSALARLRYEVARMRCDRQGMEAAIGALEAMGDQRQIRLYSG